MRESISMLCCCALVLLIGSTVVAQRSAPRQGQEQQKNKAIEVKFPKDASVPVLVMDVVGGFRMKTPEGFSPTPMVQIFADGRIATGRKSDTVKEVEGQIDLVDLKSLLVFIVDECHFFKITSESVKADLAKKRVGKIMDAGTTQITVTLRDGSNAVEVYAMPHIAGQFSDVASVASMIAIASRCRHLIAKIKLGSDDEAAASLSAVNKALSKKSAGAPKFTMANLQSAEQYVDGRRTASFVNNFADKQKQMLAYAIIQVDTKGKETVVVDVVQQK